MTPDHACQHGTEIGADGEIAALIQRRRRQTEPLAVNPAALPRPAEQRDDIAVAVIGAAIAILAHGAAEFGQQDDDRILPRTAEGFGKCCEPVAEGAQSLRQLSGMIALPDMGVPAAEADDGKADRWVVREEAGEPF